MLSTSDLADEAPLDASVDAPSSAEGGADVSPESSGGGDARVPFCQSLSPAPKHCVDFDDGNLLGFFDQVVRDPPNATTTLVADDGAARVAIDGADGCAYARLTRTVPAPGRGMRVRFKVKPSASWAKDKIYFFMNLEGGQGDCGLLLHLGDFGSSAQLHVQWGNPEQNDFNPWTEIPKVGEWSEIGIELAATDPPTVAATVNGMKAMSSKALSQCSFGSGVYVGMGFHCAAGTAEVRYDDLVIDYP